MASMTQSVRKRSQTRLRWAQDISLELQEWVDLPAVNVPRLDATDHREIRDEDIERVANECRAIWGLGKGPIADVLLVIENAGIVVVKEEVGSAKMDGVSNWSRADDRPYVLIARDKASCVRSRMDAAHELGHLVLHHALQARTLRNAADFKEIERQAFYFAGAFLMPEESFAAEISTPSLNGFLALKERWKVAIAAMMMRCANLGISSEEYHRRLWKHYSARGWRKNEPLDDILPSEEPRLLARSVRLLLDEGIRTKNAMRADFRLHAPDIESLCALPRGFMTSSEADVVEIGTPTLKQRDASARSDGDVIPFRKR